jgi:hypothetical protein
MRRSHPCEWKVVAMIKRSIPRPLENMPLRLAVRIAAPSVCALWILLAPGCNDVETPQPVVRLPLEVGRSWEYVRTFGIFNCRPDSGVLVPPLEDEALVERAAAAIVRQDSLFARGPAWVFGMAIVPLGTPVDPTQGAEEYFLEDESGLYLAAHRGYGGGVPPKPSKARIRFHGRTFDSPRELFASLTGAVDGRPSVDAESLVVEDPPLPELRYPLSVGSTWRYRQPGNPWRIDKRVVAFETVNLTTGRFECFKIQWLIDLDDDGTPEPDIEAFDWISSEGVILRRLVSRDLEWATIEGGRLGLFDSWEEYSLLLMGRIGVAPAKPS